MRLIIILPSFSRNLEDMGTTCTDLNLILHPTVQTAMEFQGTRGTICTRKEEARGDSRRGAGTRKSDTQNISMPTEPRCDKLHAPIYAEQTTKGK